MPTLAPNTTAEAAVPRVDPADFIAELHADGNFPITAGGDPAVPDNLGSDDPAALVVYDGGRRTVPAHERGMIAAHGPRHAEITV
jgi:hypothetical protein